MSRMSSYWPPQQPLSMRAIVVKHPGGPDVLELTEIACPQPGPEQVLVKVRAAALNFADTLQREGEFPPPAGESEVLGVEIAGDVVWQGLGADTAVGTRVFGLVGGGAYAEYCVLDSRMAIPIPASLSYVQASAVSEACFTANTALVELGSLQRGQTLLLHGASGGIGSMALQMARSLGARVVCTTGCERKAAKLRELGADLTVNYRSGDFVSEVRQWARRGVNLVVDVVGACAFAQNLAVLQDGGALIQIGIITGSKCEIDLDEIILRRLSIRGTVMRILPMEDKRAITARFRQGWLPLLVRGEIRPIIDSVFPLAEVADAHRRMQSGEHFGKIVLDLESLALDPFQIAAHP